MSPVYVWRLGHIRDMRTVTRVDYSEELHLASVQPKEFRLLHHLSADTDTTENLRRVLFSDRQTGTRIVGDGAMERKKEGGRAGEKEGEGERG